MTDDDTHYPNLEPDGLGIIDIKRAGKTRAPRIAWGDKYKSWPVEKRLRYAENLAATMNEAVRLKQEEYIALVAIAERQETQLIQSKKQAAQQDGVLQREITASNKRQNDLVAENRKLRAEIKRLNDGTVR